MQPRAIPASAAEILPLRTRYRQEMNCQIVHDSIHQRPGWTTSYLLQIDGATAGFGSVAIAGPWKDKPTLLEFYVLREQRTHVFALFEAFHASSNANFIELQSNDAIFAAMLHTYARNIVSEKIVFYDHHTTAISVQGAAVRCLSSAKETQKCIEERRGGAEWLLELDGQEAGKGGILFHYNIPYGDIYMEVSESFRRRGLGSYLVQELKSLAYELGAVPAARCSPDNIASRHTLQKAGFVPYAHMLTGAIVNP
jgi:ribosomal protein S18 acetylase RimI-like enzyme